MKNLIKEMFHEYTEWSNNLIHIKELDNGWTSIVLPFFNKMYDTIEIYGKKIDNEKKVVFSDDGDTIHNLLTVNPDFFNNSVLSILFDSILWSHNVKRKCNNELYIDISLEKNLSHLVIQEFIETLVTINNLALPMLSYKIQTQKMDQ